VGKKPQR